MFFRIILFLLLPVFGFSQLANLDVVKQAGTTAHPNILIIMVDDMGYNDFNLVNTPAWDSLRHKGIELSNFYVTSSCSPTRLTFLTGEYASKYGLSVPVVYPDTLPRMDLSAITYAEATNPYGYKSALYGKWHVSHDTAHFPTKQGFDEFIGFQSNICHRSKINTLGEYDWWKNTTKFTQDGYVDSLNVKNAQAYIRQRHLAGEKWIVNINSFGPHYPIVHPDSASNRVLGGSYGFYDGDKGGFDTGYEAMCEVQDWVLGDMYRFLDSLDELSNTLIVFFSDNGAQSLSWCLDGNLPLDGYKGTNGMFEGGIRSRALFLWKDNIKPRLDYSVASIYDMYPTILDLAGAPPKPGIQGKSLVPFLRYNAPITHPVLMNDRGSAFMFLYPNGLKIRETVNGDTIAISYPTSDSTFLELGTNAPTTPEELNLLREYKRLKRENGYY